MVFNKKIMCYLSIMLVAFSIFNVLPALAYSDFTVTLSQNTVTASPGSTFQIIVTVTPMPGPPPDPVVDLLISPPHPSHNNFIFNFIPNNVVPPFASTLTVQVKPGTPPGTYQIPVAGHNPVHGFRSKILNIIVSGSDFTLGISPPTVTVKQGNTAQYSILINYANPADMGTPINIQIQGLPPAASYSVTPPALLSIGTSSSTPLGAYTFTVIGSAFGKTHSVTAMLIVEEKPPSFDFSLSVSPSTLTLNIGDKKDCKVTVNLVSGSPETVTLSLSGSPPDVSHTISPTSANPTFTATVTFDASAATSTGTSTVTFTGSGGGVTREATLTLIVVEEKGFTLKASPSSITVKQGEKAVITIDVEGTGGFENTVTLKESGVPGGATSNFSPASGIPLFSSTYILEPSASTPEGSYTIKIEGSGGGKTASVQVMVNVEKSPKLETLITISVDSKGDKVTVSGTLTPAPPNAMVTLKYSGPNGATAVREVPADSEGKFSDTYKPETSGTWTVTANWKGNEEYEASSSQAVGFTVERSAFDISNILSNPMYLLAIILAIIVVAAIAALLVKGRGPKVGIAHCSKCGAKLKEEDEFCRKCGKKV